MTAARLLVAQDDAVLAPPGPLCFIRLQPQTARQAGVRTGGRVLQFWTTAVFHLLWGSDCLSFRRMKLYLHAALLSSRSFENIKSQRSKCWNAMMTQPVRTAVISSLDSRPAGVFAFPSGSLLFLSLSLTPSVCVKCSLPTFQCVPMSLLK